ncbi:MAG: EI24 domain-containing protein [Ginsengibacter sp.]
MLQEIITAIQAYMAAHRFVIRNKLWKWILVPGIIYAVLFVAGFYFFWHSSAFVIDYFFSKTGIKGWMQKDHGNLLRFFFVFGQIVLQLIFMFFYFSWFKYLFLIIGSPVFAWLSERTDRVINNKSYPFNFAQFFKDILRGISIAFRNTLWQTVYTISILIIALIPIVGWVTPVFALLIECYYLGFSMLDYTSERRGLSPSESIDFIGDHKGLAIGNGMVFYLLHLLPVIGWVIAPGYAVIAATLSLQSQQNTSESLSIAEVNKL